MTAEDRGELSLAKRAGGRVVSVRRLVAAMRVRPIAWALRALAVMVICATSLHAVRASLPPPIAADARPLTTAATTRVPTTAAAAAPSATVVPSHTPGVAVAGTRIVDTRTGSAITLVGASRSGLEYSCTGDGHFQPADFAAMRAWGMNVVRLTLSSELRANHAGACPGYHALVRAAVANAEAQGLYVILALQWTAPFDTPLDRTHGGAQCPMPDNKQDVAFWRDLAALYHGDQRVIFDLMGEPYGVSFAVWENGGPITAGCDVIGGGVAHESGVYQAIGMRGLVAVVRAVAPENVLILSGTNWGYELSGVASGHAIAGGNILYGTHPWNYGGKQPQDWDASFGTLSARYPVIATEFGSYDCGTSYTARAVSYFTARHISWLAWSWNLGGCGQPALIADWSGTPTAPYGAYLKDQMQRAAHG